MPACSPRKTAPTLIALAAFASLACDAKTPSPLEPPAEAADTATPKQSSDNAQEKLAAIGADLGHVGTAERPMMIEFSRDYCTPCQIMKPWVSDVATENPQVDVVTLNVDRQKNEHIGSFFQVTAVPSLVFVSPDGKVLRRTEGLAKKEQMNQALQELGWAP